MLDKSVQGKECPNCKEHFPCSTTLKVHSHEHALPNVKQFVTDKSKLWNNVEHLKSTNNSKTTNQLLLISYDCYICAGSYPTRDLLVQHSNSHLLGHCCLSKQCQQLYGTLKKDSITTISESNDAKSKSNIEICTELDQNISTTKSNQYQIQNDNKTRQHYEAIASPTNSKRKLSNFSNSLDSSNLKHVPKNSSMSPKSKSAILPIKRIYKCNTCQKILSSKSAHIEHARLHSKEKPYKCQICTKSYAVKATFRQHMTLHLGKQGELTSHKTSHKNYKCSVCTEGFPSREKLDYHTCPTMSKRGESFRCKICKKTFARKEWRTRHYLTSHNNGESCWSCEICGELFPDEQFYLIHAQEHFSREIKKGFLDCSVCGRKFPGKELYERHSCRGAAVVSSQ